MAEATAMAKTLAFLLFVYLFLAALMMDSSTIVDAGVDQRLSWVPAKARCQGSMAECMADEEFGMDSEIIRRILATTKYISYGALQRDSVPCSQRGASYYNCHAGAQANPYSRGCSAITRCRS